MERIKKLEFFAQYLCEKGDYVKAGGNFGPMFDFEFNKDDADIVLFHAYGSKPFFWTDIVAYAENLGLSQYLDYDTTKKQVILRVY